MVTVLIALIFLFLSHLLISNEFSLLIQRLGGGRRSIIWIWSVVFLPGTLFHEITHFFTAAALGAKTGDIDILPDILNHEEGGGRQSVRLGSVQVGRLNPIQGFFVGTAPLLSGLAVLVLLTSLLPPSLTSQNIFSFIIIGYLFFTIANSIFPSWSDIVQTLPFFLIVAIIALGVWISGVSFSLNSSSPLLNIINTLGRVLTISVVINIVILIPLLILNYVFRHAHQRHR